MLYGLLAILLTAAVVKIIILKKSAREIADEFADRLDNDTNTLIDISSHDRDMLRLANSINEQLRVLRKEHLQYHQGNTELKTAITNISHDIRTPLTAICGYLYLIKKTDDKELIHSYLEIIGERTETMKQLTEELFRYSVIVSDETEAEMQEVRVNQVLEDCIMGYCGALDEKGIVPEVHITENTIVRMVNKASLERVFSNLLNNALKYSDGDLEITLSDTGEITFSNTSQRLSAVEVEQLFDRFYTVEAARNSTGLGLSIARTLVERMGGTITASYDNKRLTIRIKL
jgi:hypothetical protein